MDSKGLARRLNYARGERGMGLNELSRAADVSASTISRIENGGYVGVTAETIVKLAAALNVSIDWLLLGKGSVGGARKAQ